MLIEKMTNTDYNTTVTKTESKIPDATDLIKKAIDFDAKYIKLVTE